MIAIRPPRPFLLLLLCLAATLTGPGLLFPSPVRAAETNPLVAPWPKGAEPAGSRMEELRIGVTWDTDSLDPAEQSTSLTANLCDLIFDSLFHQTPEGGLEARLATGYTLSDDLLRVRVRLREGVRFQDGQPLTAQAVKDSWDRLLDPGPALPLAPAMDLVESCRVVDPLTVELRLKQPFAPIGSVLAMSVHSPRSPLAVQSLGPGFRDRPVGAGPYRLREWIKGRRIVLERNEDYYGPKPTVKRLTWLVVPNHVRRENMLRSGDLDICLRPVPHNLESIRSQPGLVVRTPVSQRVHFLKPDSLKGIFKDPVVRRAVSLAIDREKLAREVLHGGSTAILGPLPFSRARTAPGESGHDPGRALTLLQKAGFDFSQTLRILAVSSNHYDQNIAQEIGRDLAGIGLRTRVRQLDWASFLAQTGRPPRADAPTLLVLNRWPPYPDPDAVLYGPFHTRGRAQPVLRLEGFSDPSFDRLMDDSRQETDPVRRTRLQAEAAERLAMDQPWTWLVAERFLVAHRAGLKNLVVTATEKIYPQSVNSD